MDPVSIFTGIKTAIDLATTIKNAADDGELQAKTSQLYDSIIGLQTSIMNMQAEHYSLQEENQSLKQKLMEMETWEQEKARYSLHAICPQVFVYASKQIEDCNEPPHWLCVKCYNQDTKSILQLENKGVGGYTYLCHNCGSRIVDHSTVSSESTLGSLNRTSRLGSRSTAF